MKKLSAFLFTCLILFAFSCGNDDESTPTNNGTNTPVHYIIPLKYLNSWFGIRAEYNSSGSPVGMAQYAIEVEKDTTVLNETWYVVPISIGDPPQVNYLDLYKNGTTGDVRLIYNYMTNPSPSRLWIKYPAAVNDTIATGANLEDTAVVTHIDTSITIQLGTYSSFRYEIIRHDGNDIYKDYYYLLPDTGFIKWETYYTPDGGTEYLQYEWELISLTLN